MYVIRQLFGVNVRRVLVGLCVFRFKISSLNIRRSKFGCLAFAASFGRTDGVRIATRNRIQGHRSYVGREVASVYFVCVKFCRNPDKKRYTIMMFNGALNVDPGAWTRQTVELSREDNRAKVCIFNCLLIAFDWEISDCRRERNQAGFRRGQRVRKSGA